MCGLSSKVLEWLQSYLEQRSQTFYLMFSIFYLGYNSSVLGSLVFTMYTRPLGIIMQQYGIKYDLHADDS
jgi:hypothetical protein